MKRTMLVLCLGFAGGMMVWHALDKSASYDEPAHLQAGYFHWQTHSFERGLEHPPLVRLIAALPLNFLGLRDPAEQYPQLFKGQDISLQREMLYGMLLIHRNVRSAGFILFAGRAMVILLTLGLFALIFLWSKKLYGENAGMLSLLLAVTTPPLLAHGSLITTDLGGTLGAVLALYCCARFLETPDWKTLLLCGLALGAAQSAKLSNLFLLPVVMGALLFFRNEEKPARRILDAGAVLLLCWLVVCAAYGFENVLPPHGLHPRDIEAYRWPLWLQNLYAWAPLPDYYLKSAGFMSYHAREGFVSTYFLGKILPHGDWRYFPAAFLVKTPVAEILLMGAAFFTLRRKELVRDEVLLLSALALYTALAMRANLNLGIRHFLFAYPVLLIFAGRSVSYFEDGKMWKKGLLACAVSLQLFETVWIAPDFIGYFNFASGGAGRGARILLDMDLGQDLKQLGRFMEKEPGAELVLSYFGTALPETYGIRAEELCPTGTQIHSEVINSERPLKEFLAVSVTHLNGYMTGERTFEWLKLKKPDQVLGHSIAVYELTNDPDSHLRIAEILARSGETAKSSRHILRAALTSPKK